MYQRAVPVLPVANIETTLRWYVDILAFTPDTFPKSPLYSFAILRGDEAEIMLQGPHESAIARSSKRVADPEFCWSVYLRASGTSVLDFAAAVEKKTQLLRGPERMFYGLVEFELCDPDGYRICVGGEVLADANVKLHHE